MISLHNVAHMVAMVIISALVHNNLDLNKKLDDLKSMYSRSQSKFKPVAAKSFDDKPRTAQSKPFRSQDDSETETYGGLKETEIQSSVWCRNGDHHLCRLTNLCYNGNTEEFVMFQGEDSVYENIDFTDGAFKLDVSSVSGHNVYQATVLSIPSIYSMQINRTWFNNTALIFKPFLSGNIMHVLHDDILPLYHSIKLIYPDFGKNGSNHQTIEILSLEDNYDSDMSELYDIFSRSNVKCIKDFASDKGLTCFKEAYLGLAKTTVWYDFGFTKPQGPVDSLKVTGNHIHSAVSYIWNHLGLGTEVFESLGDYLVLLRRKENRRILNENQLTLKIVRQIGIKIISVSFETHSLSEMISAVRNSRGVIGMHGSMLIFGIFLKPGSIMIELFPYAVNPVNYTPYKTLAKLPGMNIVYAHWANQNAANTVGHPDWPQEVGGLGQLEAEQRETIIQQSEVPPHLCCSDPSWLYHIYQDTVVDVAEVTSFIEKAIVKTTNVKDKVAVTTSEFYPSQVQNVQCSLSNQSDRLTNGKSRTYFIYLKWLVPWTNFLLKSESVHYEILIQHLSEESKPVHSHKTLSTSLTVNVDKFGLYYVWVRCVVNEIYGGSYSNFVTCEEDDIEYRN